MRVEELDLRIEELFDTEGDEAISAAGCSCCCCCCCCGE